MCLNAYYKNNNITRTMFPIFLIPLMYALTSGYGLKINIFHFTSPDIKRKKCIKPIGSITITCTEYSVEIIKIVIAIVCTNVP